MYPHILLAVRGEKRGFHHATYQAYAAHPCAENGVVDDSNHTGRDVN